MRKHNKSLEIRRGKRCRVSARLNSIVSLKHMKTKVSVKLKAMCSDFEAVTGKRFSYFYCPILLIDEKTELCEAHIVNKAFPNTARSWTIQRKDVDSFFGRHFESDFLKLEYKNNNLSPDQVVFNFDLSKKFRPKVTIRDKSVGYYYTTNDVPPSHSKFILSDLNDTPSLVLKIAPEEIEETTFQDDFQIEINHDLRLCSLVSLIKSAYLTLFEMIGYRYSLSVAGILIGYGALGVFYNKNKSVKDKEQFIENAKKHFETYVNLVRPVENMPFDFAGTCKDRQFFLCENKGAFWGCIVFVKISDRFHAVLLPIYENKVGETEFFKFIESPIQISARRAKFNGNSWLLDKTFTQMKWPDNRASLYN